MPSKRTSKRPKSLRYRNLHFRGRAIYYERLVGGQRHRLSTSTQNWDLAAEVRDEYERRHGIDEDGVLQPLAVPTFGEFSQRYLKEDTQHLAPSTLGDLPGYLREGGPLADLNDQLITDLDAPFLLQWWRREILGRVINDNYFCRTNDN